MATNNNKPFGLFKMRDISRQDGNERDQSYTNGGDTRTGCLGQGSDSDCAVDRD
jgi:hypothetical protein